MFMRTTTRQWIVALITTALVLGFAACYASAEAVHSGHQHHEAGHSQAVHNHARHKAYHGGQLSETKEFCFEVVYRPTETRIYLYDHSQEHLSMRGVSGQATMQIRGNDQVKQFSTKYVAPKPAGTHDYLSVPVDVRRMRDGDMKMTFVLKNLPSATEPVISFTQTIALSKSKSMVTVVPLTDLDRGGVARQAVCPVLGTKLGSHGAPIKLLVANQTLYVCCEGCIAKVKAEPRMYVAKLGGTQLD